MKLTRRGRAVVGIGLLAFFLGSIFGARALDAVVVPAIAALAIAIVQVKLTDRPEVDRTVPEPGFPGEKRIIRLRIDTSSPVSITDQLGSGLRPRTIERTVSEDGAVEYEVELERRGVYDVGPLSVTVRDSLGLVATEYRYSGFEPLLVYPPIRRLTSPGPLAGMIEAEGLIERQAFDQLREYVPGDSLRDIHWNTSAKRQGDLFVVEYTPENSEGISIAAEATADQCGASIDAMATATASVVTYLLDQGAEVSLAVPNGTLGQSNNERQSQEALSLLARTRPGRVSTERVGSADVYILGEHGRATIEIDGRQIPFDQLTGGNDGRNDTADNLIST